jgi:hypothetical protein
MKAAYKFSSQRPGRLEYHPAHEDVIRGDPEAFRLHVEFVHAHGVPKGQFTTFSTRVSCPNGARGK